MMRLRVRGWLRRNQSNRRDHDDLEQAAMVALVAAAERFDSPLAEWPTFAWPRAIGAIYDEIRKSRPAGFRRNSQRRLDVSGVREPLPVLVSMSAPARLADGEKVTVGDTIPALAAFDSLGSEELRAAISCLPVELHSVVDLVYLKDRRPTDVAEMLGVTPAMVAIMTRQARGLLEQSLVVEGERSTALKRLRSRRWLRTQRGRSVEQVAEGLGVSVRTVREWMRFYGLKPSDLS